MGIPEVGEKGTQAIFEAIMTKNFPKLMIDTKSDPGNSEYNQDKS